MSQTDPQKALYGAVKTSSLAPMLAALEQGARLEEPFHGDGISPRDQGWHALGMLCEGGGDSLEYVLRAVLPYVRDINARQPLNSAESMRNTPAIAHAAKSGLVVIKLLADAGADLSLEWQDKGGVTWNALDVALMRVSNSRSGGTYYLVDPAPEVPRFLYAAGLRPRRYLSDIALLESGVYSNPYEQQNIEKLGADNRPAALAESIQRRRREHAFQMMALADDPSEGTGMPNHDVNGLAELGALQCVTVLGPADYSRVSGTGHPGKAALRSGDPAMLRLMMDRGLDPFLEIPVVTSSGPRQPFIYWVYLSQQPEMIGVVEDFLGMEDRRPIWRALRAVRREMEHLASVIRVSQGLDEVQLQNLVRPFWPAWTSREVMQTRSGKLQRAFRQLDPAIKDGDLEIIAAVLEDLGALPPP